MRRLVVLGLAVVLGCATVASPAVAQDKPVAAKKVERTAKQKDIEKLLRLSGSGEIGVQVVTQIIDMYRQTMPQVPKEFWDDSLKEISADALVELIIPIYDRHFTHDDIKELIKFYQSPIGKKFVGVLPQITQESQMAGQQWGMQIAEKVARRLQEKGYHQ